MTVICDYLGGDHLGKEIIEIKQSATSLERRLRVAAYARVSSGKDAMLHSLAAQIDYYRNLINSNVQWQFAGVYADEAKTGTKEDRDEFQLLLTKCRDGSVDMIITKSVSRFARNTVTLLSTVRELRDLGVDVYFEEQNIHTISGEGELFLTLLASFAQEESLSVSDNVQWRIRHGFEEGRPSSFRLLGYRWTDGEITVVPEEMGTVRRIFELYLEGKGTQSIANTLNAEGRTTLTGGIWYPSTVSNILTNEKYCGDLLLQKSYVLDHISKRSVRNTGQLPQFLVEENHEAIIDKALFQQAAVERERRSFNKGKAFAPTAFAGMIRCDCCGKNYRRKAASRCIKWCCGTFNTRGKAFCPDSKMIPEETVVEAVCTVLGLEEFDSARFLAQVERIDACKGNLLRFHLCDGSTQEYIWRDRSRAESWTPEMKKAAALATARRYQNGRKENNQD